MKKITSKTIMAATLGSFLMASATLMTGCSSIEINFDALKEMFSPVKEHENTIPEEPDVPVLPEEPEEPVTPEEPETPEDPVAPKTEAEFKVACEEKLKEIVLDIIQDNSPKQKFSNVRNLIYNINNGVIYCNVDLTLSGDNKTVRFYTIKTGLAIEATSYQDAFDDVCNIRAKSVDWEGRLKDKVSAEKYNELCEYVLDKVGLEGARILNTSTFSEYNYYYYDYLTNWTVELNNKIYNLQTLSTSYGKSEEEHINSMLKNVNNEISILSEEEFRSFDEIGKIQVEDMNQEVQPQNAPFALYRENNGKWALNFDSRNLNFTHDSIPRSCNIPRRQAERQDEGLCL